MFGIILLLIFAAIVFWHYLQGFFSATLSAIFAIVAVALAVGYVEPVVNFFKPGKYADSANALVLSALFFVIYLALRLIFDLLVPGNLRLQTNIDKIGGAVMGVIVALCTTGIIALVAQLLPLGADVGGYARYPITAERDVTIQLPGGQMKDAAIFDELKTDGFVDAGNNASSGDQPDRPVGEARWGKPSGLLIPVDDFLIGTVSFLSGGSLASDQQWSMMHPDYLQEIFGQRLGPMAGVARSAPNYPGDAPRVTVAGVYSLDSIPARDGLEPEVRQNQAPFPSGVFKPGAGQMLLVVRTHFSRDAADSDGIFRFTPASCRLVVRHGDSGPSEDYYPIGTLEAARRLYVNRLDDPLFVEVNAADKEADLVYLINHAEDVCAQAAAPGPVKLAPGLVLEVKRLGVVDLSKDDHGNDRMLANPIEPSANVAVMRQVLVQPLPLTGTVDQVAVNQAPVLNLIWSRSNLLPVALGIGSPQANGKVRHGSVEGDLEGGKFTNLTVTSKDPLIKLIDKPTVEELATKTGDEIVQFKGEPNPSMRWNAMRLSNFELLCDDGSSHRASGAWCILKSDGGEQKMLGAYQISGTPTLPELHGGTPMQIWIAFSVPTGKDLVELRYGGKTILDLRAK